ncbi:hypothetical protein A7A08_01364 [Methyloligella halotolerans]|uniref:Flp/Fap pilin component n=1 Tax=Methyloligella halotolerans TaxID=1177755 RepID=A0A1E2RZ10_9HYPH|nr:hypothetical protein [Methyloligella halotolerans]ODA67338.1 hypothetical protein A7A08_01364 [Methyloligella halotolerans]
MQDFKRRVVDTGRRFVVSEDGTSAVEYAFFMLISIAIIAALSFFTDALIGAYQAAVNALMSVMA